MNTVTLVFIFTKEMQHLHEVVLSADLIMHMECGHAVFGKHSKFSIMRCRKFNFVLIDVKVGLLLTFLVSMKAKIHMYQKCVSVFGCLHMKS